MDFYRTKRKSSGLIMVFDHRRLTSVPMQSMTTDDYSFCQEESTTLSGGSLPSMVKDGSNNDDIPSAVLDPSQGENAVTNQLGELIELLKGNQERSEGSNMASCIFELVQRNERLSAQVMKGREENLRLRQECDALKANVEMLEGKPGKQQVNRIEGLAKGQDENKASITDLQETLASAVQDNLEDDQNNVDNNNPHNLGACVTSGMYTVPSQSPILWKDSKSNESLPGCTDILDCLPMRCGKRYKWSIKVIAGFGFQLGVFHTIKPFCPWLTVGDQKGGWVYFSEGTAYHAGKTVHSNLPRYQPGSKLTFILDLTGNGTLSVYQDDVTSNLIELFVNMKSDCDISPFAPYTGFLPAVSYHESSLCSTLEFLGFEDH